MKAGVVDVQSEYGLLDTSSTRGEMNKSIKWTNRLQIFSVALFKAQEHCKLAIFCLITPSKNGFSYILHSFKIPLKTRMP